MIYFFAGAPKHGSHFQLYIITEAMKQKGLTYEPKGEKIFDSNDSTRAKALLDELNLQNDGFFVCKGHFLDKNLLLSYENIRVFLIWREIGDVLVSRYHYLKNRYGRKFVDFEDYYKKDGRRHMFYQRAYWQLWGEENDSRIINVNYGALRQNFADAVTPMLKFVGLEDVDLGALEQQVSLDQTRKKNDPEGILIRKGAVGEYESVIPPHILEDISKIYNMSQKTLKIYAFLNDPKVLFSKYYQYPGKFLVLAIVRKILGRDKKDRKTKGRKVLWWD